jgi:outer membrane protein OmpA-like peptidoglycan-associated protein
VEQHNLFDEEIFVNYSNLFRSGLPLLSICVTLFATGCVATQEWVNEQLFPINKRVSETEAGLTKTDGRVTNVEGKVANVDARVDTMAKQIAALENRLTQTNAKADRALESLQRLKPEKKMVLNFTEGALFATNSIQFSGQAKKDIDSFLSDIKGSSDESSLLFVVAGHSDSLGADRSNYELSKRRAESIAGYLTTERKIDPVRIVVVGYGESAPVADNRTEAGRAKNRRVEILVYRESVGVGTAATEPRAAVKTR